jgi:DNA-binding CsgD family transcriptional regulator
MLESLLQNLGVAISDAQERAQGAAFLRVAREAYPLSSVVYVALNIPIKTGSTERFVHCTYGDAWARHAASAVRANVERRGVAALFHQSRDENGFADSSTPSVTSVDRQLAIALSGYHGESAALVIKPDESLKDWHDRSGTIAREFRALGQYFHQHMLRIFGRGDEKAIIVSAREIDCLRWMAAGKTAWEASAILGISERTVRFHLNAAREKLQCATTTQAVAKAISQQLFVP